MVTRGHKGRVDANQTETVKALRAAGMSVQILSGIGQGCPDLLVGFRGCNVLIELKDGAKDASKQALTAAEESWQAKWAGQVETVDCPERAVLAVLRYEALSKRL